MGHANALFHVLHNDSLFIRMNLDERINDTPHFTCSLHCTMKIATNGNEKAFAEKAKKRDRNARAPSKKAPSLDDDTLKKHVLAYYKINSELRQNGEPEKTMTAFVKERRIESHRSALIRTYQKSGLKGMFHQKKNYGESVRFALEDFFMEKIENKTKKTEQFSKARKYLSDDEELFLNAVVVNLGTVGTTIDKKTLTDAVNMIVDLREDSRERVAVSDSVIRGLLKRLNIKARNASNIDPARARQATEEVKDVMFQKLDNLCFLMHCANPTRFPWKSWDEVPAANKYNMDELSTDTTKHRSKVLVSQENFFRIFRQTMKKIVYQQTIEGDKMARHITVALTSRSDGRYAVPGEQQEGAPPPFIIHADGASSENEGTTAREKRLELAKQTADDEVRFNYAYAQGLEDKDTELDEILPPSEYDNNRLGLAVRTSTNGSITKDLFFDWAIHFVKNLPRHQGKDGEPVYLILDGHVSRLNIRAMNYLFENNVICFFLASHTSIWSQPNDNGPNYLLHKCFNEAARIERLFATQADSHYFNTIIKRGWREFLSREHGDLDSNLMRNSTTGSWRKTGLEPADRNPETWQDAIRDFGQHNKIFESLKQIEAALDGATDEKSLDKKWFTARVRPQSRRPPSFTEQEIESLKQGVNTGDQDISSEEMKQPLMLCHRIIDSMIDAWVSIPAETRPPEPTPGTNAEKIASKFVECIHTVVVDWKPKSEQALGRERVEALVRSRQLLSDSIQVQKNGTKPSDKRLTAVRQAQDKWLVVESNSTLHVSTDDLLDESKWRINTAAHQDAKTAESNRLRQKNHRLKMEEKALAKRVADKEAADMHRDLNFRLLTANL